MSISAAQDSSSQAFLSRSTNPSKRCINCKSRFYRKENETLAEFNERDTCSHDCKRTLKGFNRTSEKEYDYRVTDPELRTCVNCVYMHDDSEVGDYCGPCNNGSNYKAKNKRRVTDV